MVLFFNFGSSFGLHIGFVSVTLLDARLAVRSTVAGQISRKAS